MAEVRLDARRPITTNISVRFATVLLATTHTFDLTRATCLLRQNHATVPVLNQLRRLSSNQISFELLIAS